MNCINCKILYNDEKNYPMLLPECGHSVCLNCLKLNSKKKYIKCEKCKKKNEFENIEDFPQNVTIIDLIENKFDEISLSINIKKNKELFKEISLGNLDKNEERNFNEFGNYKDNQFSIDNESKDFFLDNNQKGFVFDKSKNEFFFDIDNQKTFFNKKNNNFSVKNQDSLEKKIIFFDKNKNQHFFEKDKKKIFFEIKKNQFIFEKEHFKTLDTEKIKNNQFLNDFEIRNYLNCQNHNLKFEAFCCKEKKLICLECILSKKHNKHKIITINEIFLKKKNLLLKKIKKSNLNKKKIFDLEKKNDFIFQNSKDNYLSSLEIVENEFFKVINKINNKKKKIILDIKEKFFNFEKNHNKIKKKIETIRNDFENFNFILDKIKKEDQKIKYDIILDKNNLYEKDLVNNNTFIKMKNQFEKNQKIEFLENFDNKIKKIEKSLVDKKEKKIETITVIKSLYEKKFEKNLKKNGINIIIKKNKSQKNFKFFKKKGNFNISKIGLIFQKKTHERKIKKKKKKNKKKKKKK